MGFEADVKETTELTVFAVRANGLFNYYPNKRSVYFITGFGFVVANVYWEQKQTPRDPGFTGVVPEPEDEEVTSAGNIINLGIGKAFGPDVEVRLETPMLFFYNAAGEASTFAPTMTLGITYWFR